MSRINFEAGESQQEKIQMISWCYVVIPSPGRMMRAEDGTFTGVKEGALLKVREWPRATEGCALFAVAFACSGHGS